MHKDFTQSSNVYRFDSERKNFKGITVTVQFKLADKEKATKIFEDLLNSIKLK